MRAPFRLLLAVLGPLALVACGDDDSATTASQDPGGDVTVFAAASLTDAFTEIGDAFEDAHPGAEVALNFAASSELATQIIEGAPADVFASADSNNMTKLIDAGSVAGEPVVFTTNLAEIIVGAGNPEGITGVADLADPDLIVISCAPEVPCGRYAEQVFDNAGVTVTPRSLEENVRSVVSKVALGEADAGIVYVTDVLGAADGVEGVEIPADINVVAQYPVAVTTQAPHPDAAAAFVEFVLSDDGQAVLASYGFVSP